MLRPIRHFTSISSKAESRRTGAPRRSPRTFSQSEKRKSRCGCTSRPEEGNWHTYRHSARQAWVRNLGKRQHAGTKRDVGGVDGTRTRGLRRDRQEQMTVERSRPRKIGVGCHASRPVETDRGRLFQKILQVLASGDTFDRDKPRTASNSLGLWNIQIGGRQPGQVVKFRARIPAKALGRRAAQVRLRAGARRRFSRWRTRRVRRLLLR
jgi:hypothetical protein